MDKERMVQSSMDEMCRSFHQAHTSLDETVNAARDIAKMMQDGALLGQAGDEFRQAIESQLIPRVKRLADKLMEMEGDVRSAAARIHQAETQSEQRFQ